MLRYLLLILGSVLFVTPTFAQPAGKGFVEVTEEDASPKCYGYSIKFANGSVTDNADGTCSVAGGGSSSGGITGSGTTGTIPKWSSSSALTDSVIVESSAKIGINSSPSTGTDLDIWGGNLTIMGGADNGLTTRTNATAKAFRICGAHYTNTEECVGALYINSGNGFNVLNIGGNTSTFNAPTDIYFWTAANSTTVTGTQRMYINPNGKIATGAETGSPDAWVEFVGDAGGDEYFMISSAADGDGNIFMVDTAGEVGIATTGPDTALEVNSATGSNLRLTYNDSNGSAANYANFAMSSSGDLTLTATGGDISFDNERLTTTGTLSVGDASSSSAQLTVLGGSVGGDMLTLSRTSGATISYSFALAGGGLSFKDVTNGFVSASFFGDSLSNDMYLGNRNKTTSDTARPSIFSGQTYSSSAGTDVNAGNLTIRANMGTGAGTPGNLLFQTGTALGTGTTAQSGTTRMTIAATTGDVTLTAGLTTPGFVDFGGSTFLEIPNGTGPTANDVGEIAHDTTDNQIILDDYVFSHRRQLNIPVANPATGTYLIGKAVDGMTVNSINCIVDPAGTGENTVIQLQECDSTGDNCTDVDSGTDITCDNDGAADDGSLSNPSIDANDWYALEIVSVSGTVSQAIITVDYETVRE